MLICFLIQSVPNRLIKEQTNKVFVFVSYTEAFQDCFWATLVLRPARII